MQQYAIELGDSTGIRSLASAARSPSSQLLVLDRTSLRLHVVDTVGDVARGLRLRRFVDGSWPEHVTVSGDGTVWLFSGSSSHCRRYDATLKHTEDCELPDRFRRISQVFFASGYLVVLGWADSITTVLHTYTADLSAVGTFGRPRELNPADSILLGWGLGLASAGPGADLTHVRLNPFEVSQYSLAGEPESWWNREVEMKRAEEFAVDVANEGRRLVDVFERCVGVGWVGDYMIYLTYSPQTDVTTIRILSKDGNVISASEVPFAMSLVASSDVGELYVVRSINGYELVRYQLQLYK